MNCEDFFGNVLCFSQDFKGKIDIKKGGKKNHDWLIFAYYPDFTHVSHFSA